MNIHPQLTGFILFCIRRRGTEWPALYDEMCWVARRGLYNGLFYDDLRRTGLSLSLDDLDQTTSAVDTVMHELCDGIVDDAATT